MGLSGGVRHIGECQMGRLGGTDGLDVQETGGEAMRGRFLVVTRSVRFQEMAGTA